MNDEISKPQEEQQGLPRDKGAVQPESDNAATPSKFHPANLLAAPLDFFNKATKPMPPGFPIVEVPDGANDTTKKATDKARNGGAARDLPDIVDKAIKQISDSPDPVMEMVGLMAGHLENVKEAKIYQTVNGDYHVQLSLNEARKSKLVNKSIGPLSAGPVEMSNIVGLTAHLTPSDNNGVAVNVNGFYGFTPTILGPIQDRVVKPGPATLMKGSDGQYHFNVSGQASRPAAILPRNSWTKEHYQVIDPEDILDPNLRALLSNGRELDQLLGEALKLQNSKEILDCGITRSANADEKNQFDLKLTSRNEKHIELNENVSAMGATIKVEGLTLSPTVNATLSYSHEKGIQLSGIDGIKINADTDLPLVGRSKQVVSPKAISFGKDDKGKAVVGLEFCMISSDGPSAPITIAIPFSKILEQMSKR